jgi:hypothetical protein
LFPLRGATFELGLTKGKSVDPDRREQTDQGETPSQSSSAQERAAVESGLNDVSRLLNLNKPTTLVAVPVDPYVVHCQWEVTPSDLEGAKQALGVGENEYWPVLQFHDVSNVAPDQSTHGPSFAVDVSLGAENWYVRSCVPSHAYRADLALRSEEGSVRIIASSERVETPPSAPSTYTDINWMPIRPGPQIPESAAKGPSPQGLDFERALQNSAECSEPPVVLPIDMTKEVRIKLTSLYGEPPPEVVAPPLETQSAPAPQLFDGPRGNLVNENISKQISPTVREQKPENLTSPSLSPLPIDMRDEIARLYTQLYDGLRQEPLVSADGTTIVSQADSFFMETFRRYYAHRVAGSGPGVPSSSLQHEAPRHNRLDLTELNERSFASGIFSRTA